MPNLSYVASKIQIKLFSYYYTEQNTVDLLPKCYAFENLNFFRICLLTCCMLVSYQSIQVPAIYYSLDSSLMRHQWKGPFRCSGRCWNDEVLCRWNYGPELEKWHISKVRHWRFTICPAKWNKFFPVFWTYWNRK